MILVGTKRLNRTCDWNYSFSVLWPAFLNSLTRIHLEKFETLSLIQRYKTLSRRRPTIDSCHRCVHIRGNSLETSLCNFMNREFLRLCLEHYTRPRNNREKTKNVDWKEILVFISDCLSKRCILIFVIPFLLFPTTYHCLSRCRYACVRIPRSKSGEYWCLVASPI